MWVSWKFMGCNQNKTRIIFFYFVILSFLSLSYAHPATPQLDKIKLEINLLEKELLHSKDNHLSAELQLRKIKKLLKLQQREIELSQQKINELSKNTEELSIQKQVLLDRIRDQKIKLRHQLAELYKFTESENIDATWIFNLDSENQKSYFLSKVLKKETARIVEYRKSMQEALALELQIIEEKNKLDYYVEELKSQVSTLSENENLQQEILSNNHTNRIDALKRIRILKESERELEKMISSIRVTHQLSLSFIQLKGKLPRPVHGPILSYFGKSYNSKTSLLTFQKGITLGGQPLSTVHAIASGKVVFSGPLKSYGQIMIIEHPGNFFSLYGQMGRVVFEYGQSIKQGDVVGHMSDEPLYFEIRDKNVAINPLQWFENSSIHLTKH